MGTGDEGANALRKTLQKTMRVLAFLVDGCFGGRRFENEWAVAEIDDDDDDDSLCARADEARRVRANCALHLLCPRIFGVQNNIDELREEKRDVCLCTISRRQVMRGRWTSSMLHERK